MKIKKHLLQIIGFSIGIIAGITILSIVMGTDTCILCGKPIHHTPSEVDPNGWIAENGGGGTLCTTNLGISARLDRIEKRLDALSNRLERLEHRIPPSP